jgi:hypothetical protein
MPAPISLAISSTGWRGRPSASIVRFAASAISPAVSTSVPSRSKLTTE